MQPVGMLKQRIRRHLALGIIGWISLLATGNALAQQVPVPVDRPYPGTIVLTVDTTQVNQKIFNVHERIPVQPGKLTLLYPQWLPGEHSPTAPLALLAGLIVTGNQQRIEWQRDLVNMYAFHLTVPSGVKTLDVDFQFLSAINGNLGETFVTAELLAVHWEKVILYPAGFYSHNLLVQPSIKFPTDWKFAGALEPLGQDNQLVHFKAVDLEDLIDSPIYAGKYFTRFDLDPGAAVPVYFDFFAEDPDDLVAKPEQIDMHRTLLQQAYKLFGSHHFNHYDFLVMASDSFGFSGLEHHQSGENLVKPDYFSDWDNKGFMLRAGLIPHEFAHSWDGKFRRPADQLTPNFNLPMQDSLLWVYEGQTQYWGYVLAARSGLLTKQQVIDALADDAAHFDVESSRLWRTLADSTNDPIVNQRRPLAWRSYQGAENYYTEGQLVWLDVDTKIRELTNDTKSLNDFAREFFGVENGRVKPLTYTFADVAATLNHVAPYGWAQFLRTRLESHGPGAPLDGLARAGWKLVFTSKPSDFDKAVNAEYNVADFWFSIGMTIGAHDRIQEVLWNSPAFKAGLTVDMVVAAVNGKEYKEDVLKRAITEANKTNTPIELLIKNEGRYQTVRIAYFDGLKYPHLEAIPGAKDRLADIFAPIK